MKASSPAGALRKKVINLSTSRCLCLHLICHHPRACSIPQEYDYCAEWCSALYSGLSLRDWNHRFWLAESLSCAPIRLRCRLQRAGNSFIWMPVFRLRICQNMVTFTMNILMLPFRDAGRLTQGADWDTEGRAPRWGKEGRNQAKFRHSETYTRKIRAPQVLAE